MIFRYNTPLPLARWDEPINRLLGSFFDPSPLPRTHRAAGPAAVAWEDGEALYVELEIPGVKNEQIDLSVADGKLTVKVEPPPEAESEDRGERYLRRERRAGNLGRVFDLPAEIDTTAVEASLVDGVLTITLPKAEAAKPRKISVRAG